MLRSESLVFLSVPIIPLCSIPMANLSSPKYTNIFHDFYWYHLSLVVFLFPSLPLSTLTFHTMTKVIFLIHKSYLSAAAMAPCYLGYKSPHLYNRLGGPTSSTMLAFLVSAASTIPLACSVAATVAHVFPTQQAYPSSRTVPGCSFAQILLL